MKVPFNESNRLIFNKDFGVWLRANNRRISLIAFYLASSIGLVAYLYHHSVSTYRKGFQDGLVHALNTRNPSPELELACAGLWIGEQNKKYFNKQK